MITLYGCHNRSAFPATAHVKGFQVQFYGIYLEKFLRYYFCISHAAKYRKVRGLIVLEFEVGSFTERVFSVLKSRLSGKA